MTRTAGRQWVKLHTRIIQDDAFLDGLSTAAKLAFVLSMAKAGADFTEGVITTVTPRAVSRWTGMDVAECEAAIAELFSAGYWVADGDAAQIESWATYQSSNDQLEGKRKADAERQARHRAAKTAAPAPEPQPEAAPEPTPEPQPEGPTRADVVELVWTALDQRVPEDLPGDDAVKVYRAAYTHAEQQAKTRYAEVKGVGVKMLTDLVVDHAAQRLLGVDTTQRGKRNRLHALTRDHGFRTVEVMPSVSTWAEGDPLAALKHELGKNGGAR